MKTNCVITQIHHCHPKIVASMKIKEINHEAVYDLRKMKYSWVVISARLGVSTTLLKRWRHRVNFEDPLLQAEADDNVLVPIITAYFAANPLCGERMLNPQLMGSLRDESDCAS